LVRSGDSEAVDSEMSLVGPRGRRLTRLTNQTLVPNVAKVLGIGVGGWLSTNESNRLDIEIKKRGIVKHGADQVDKLLKVQ